MYKNLLALSALATLSNIAIPPNANAEIIINSYTEFGSPITSYITPPYPTNSQDTSLSRTISLKFSYSIAPGLNFAIVMNQNETNNPYEDPLNNNPDEVRASIKANF